VLYWLCGDVNVTMAINGFLEGCKLSTTILMFSGFVAIAALAEILPFELRWAGALVMPDIVRKLLKLNTEALGLVLRELDFWLPFTLFVLAMYFFSYSFGHDPGAGLMAFLCVLMYTINVLLGDADLTKRAVESKSSRAVKYALFLVLLLVVTVMLTFGLFRRAENRKFRFKIFNNDEEVESISLYFRFVSTPLVFLCKHIVKSIQHRGRTIVIKMPLIRHDCTKRELYDILRQRDHDHSHRARTRTMLAGKSSSSDGGAGPATPPVLGRTNTYGMLVSSFSR